MDIIHALSNLVSILAQFCNKLLHLVGFHGTYQEEEEVKRNWVEFHGIYQEIETTHSSSSQQVEEEEEVNRNWLELPPDVLSLIFMKLGTIDILAIAQWVCTSWWKLSKQPHVFRSIHVDHVYTLFDHAVQSVWLDSNLKISREMAREAINRSCGQLVEFSVRAIANDELLHYMSEKSSSLRCLRLVNYEGFVTDGGLIEIAKKLPQLEKLEIIHSDFSKDVIETFGRFCPQLKSCRLNYVTCCTIFGIQLDGVSLAIAENMPEIRHLNLFGDMLTANGLTSVLECCPHLESLDLRQCFDLKFAGDLEQRCGNLKVLRLPNDPTDDFEYELQHYSNHGYLEYEFDYETDYA